MGLQGLRSGQSSPEAFPVPARLSFPLPPSSPALPLPCSFRKEHLFFVVVIVYDFIYLRQRA